LIEINVQCQATIFIGGVGASGARPAAGRETRRGWTMMLGMARARTGAGGVFVAAMLHVPAGSAAAVGPARTLCPCRTARWASTAAPTPTSRCASGLAWAGDAKRALDDMLRDDRVKSPAQAEERAAILLCTVPVRPVTPPAP
jgi:hypothetical protein